MNNNILQVKHANQKCMSVNSNQIALIDIVVDEIYIFRIMFELRQILDQPILKN